jgi:hypothetical protein
MKRMNLSCLIRRFKAITRPLALLIVVLFSLSMVQEEPDQTFIIKDQASIPDINQYIHALSKANLESYRLLDERSHLVFEPRKVVVDLLSARELVAKGKKIDLALYPSAFPKKFKMPMFSVSPEGRLLARYDNKGSKFH